MANDDDETERRILTRKELAKEQRRAAYQRQKAQRATDPRYLAMKEAAKEQRRAAYKKVKEGRQAESAASKRVAKERRVAERDAQDHALEAKHRRTAERVALAASSAQADLDALTQDKVDSSSEIALSDSGLWKYVNWATKPKLLS